MICDTHNKYTHTHTHNKYTHTLARTHTVTPLRIQGKSSVNHLKHTSKIIRSCQWSERRLPLRHRYPSLLHQGRPLPLDMPLPLLYRMSRLNLPLMVDTRHKIILFLQVQWGLTGQPCVSGTVFHTESPAISEMTSRGVTIITGRNWKAITYSNIKGYLWFQKPHQT